MITLQQSHDINSLNGDNLDCNVHEAQTLANTTCDFNMTFQEGNHFTARETRDKTRRRLTMKSTE